MNPLIQQLMSFLQTHQQPQSDSDILLQFVYEMLHTKFKNTEYLPDHMRENEQAEQNKPKETPNKSEYLDLLMKSEPDVKSIPQAQVQTTRKIY